MTGTTSLILGAITLLTASAVHGGGADTMTLGIGQYHTTTTDGTAHSATEDGITVLHGITHGTTTAGIVRGTTTAGTTHGITTVSGIIHGILTAGIMEEHTTHTMVGTQVGIHIGTITDLVSQHMVQDI